MKDLRDALKVGMALIAIFWLGVLVVMVLSGIGADAGQLMLALVVLIVVIIVVRMRRIK